MTKSKNNSAQKSPLRFLPSVDALLKTESAIEISQSIGASQTTEFARAAIERVRRDIVANQDGEFSRQSLLSRSETALREHYRNFKRARFQRVINATGIIVHTNLGRAPLAEAARLRMLGTAAGYCTLEYDLETGARGRRGKQTEELLCEITGAEAALIVNNCAAAAFLILSALASGGEAVVSRGELVEIGGDFRIPDVMAEAGAKLVEVGTTNRTKLRDFADAINENTKMLVRVHPSNFRIVGFVEMPELAELANLAREKNVLLFEDAGSGALVNLGEFGLTDEPLIADSVKAGADIICFSADKLLGGVQAGLIVGKREAVDRLRKHPLYRALRVDKIVYAALAATLEIYKREKHFAEIPVLRMLAQTRREIEQRAKVFLEEAEQLGIRDFRFTIVAGASAVGGGSAPLAKLETALIALQHKTLSAEELERQLRFSIPPVVARIAEDSVMIDLRTVTDAEANEVLSILLQINQKN